MSDDIRMSLDELERLRISHVPMTMITAAEGEQSLEEFLKSGEPGSIQTRSVQVCRECFMSTNSIMVAVWPCTAAKLIARNQEMTDLVQRLWDVVENIRGRTYPHYRERYEHLGLHVER
jgi:hypothetical protein